MQDGAHVSVVEGAATAAPSEETTAKVNTHGLILWFPEWVSESKTSIILRIKVYKCMCIHLTRSENQKHFFCLRLKEIGTYARTVIKVPTVVTNF